MCLSYADSSVKEPPADRLRGGCLLVEGAEGRPLEVGADTLGVELVGAVAFGVQAPAAPAHVALVDVGVAQLDGEKRRQKGGHRSHARR